MTTPSPASVIERLEKATGPDRELDGDIYLFLHPEMRQLSETATGSIKPEHYSSPVYTASIDAALTLVPEGWCWSAHGGDVCRPGAQLDKPQIETADGEIIVDQAATTAIALCIASLKARIQGTRP